MTAAPAVNAPRLDRERPAALPVNVMPACLACGSYFVNEVEAKIDAGRHLSMENAFGDGCHYMTLVACQACGFVASGAAVTS
jgi:hypothetical protein